MIEEKKQHHYVPLMQLAYPILIGQIAQTGMGTVDTIMAGRYNALDLAAIAIGQSLWLPLIIFFIGIFTASATIIANLSGQENTQQIRHTFQQSCWLALIMIPLGILLLQQTTSIATLMGLEAVAIPILDQYINMLCYGLPAGILFYACRGFIEGTGYTKPIMVISVLCFLINIPLNYVFIFGKFGFPEMGGAGSGVATSICQWLMLLGALWVCINHKKIRLIQGFKNFSLIQASSQFKILRLGIPISFTMVAEVGMFAAIALLIAPLGTITVASHQIALSVSAITFMLPLSMGIALMIRVGHLNGAQQSKAAKQCVYDGITLGVIACLANTLFIYGLRQEIAEFYSKEAEVILIASGILIFTAMYQIVDGIQISATHALRGYHDTRVSLLIALVAYWLISAPIGYALCMGYTPLGKIGVNGMWIGLVIGLTVAAIFQCWRLHFILNKYRHQSLQV